MGDATFVVNALRSQTKSLKLNNRKLSQLPRSLGLIVTLQKLDLRHNNLTSLPDELIELSELQELYLGDNQFEDLPLVISKFHKLKKFHIYKNNLRFLNPDVIGCLTKLTVLSLNDNYLIELPPEICRLEHLEVFSAEGNFLQQLPMEFCALTKLREVRLAYNRLICLPMEFGFLVKLEKLYLQKNKLSELPESFGKLYNLRILDIAANELRIFPTMFTELPLREFYHEGNPFLRMQPVHSVQEEEVLSLKEILARYVMKELKDRWSYLRRSIRHYPQVREMLSQCSRCAVCGEAFLNTWLECVRFVEVKKSFTSCQGSSLQMPVRALLCSYQCFNAGGHDYYGVAFP